MPVRDVSGEVAGCEEGQKEEECPHAIHVTLQPFLILLGLSPPDLPRTPLVPVPGENNFRTDKFNGLPEFNRKTGQLS